MNGKLERWLNELARDPEVGPYVKLIAGQIQAVIRQLGVERSWNTLVRAARRVVDIEQEG